MDSNSNLLAANEGAPSPDSCCYTQQPVSAIAHLSAGDSVKMQASQTTNPPATLALGGGRLSMAWTGP